MALPSCLLVSVGGRRSQRPGPSPTLGSLGPSHQRRHKSRVSLRGPPCAHGVSGTPYGEVRDKDLAVRVDDAIWSNPLWKAANDEFEEYLSSDTDLHQFRNKYFYVYEGNHRVTAWMGYIHKYHSNNPDWYISVDCIVLDARGECSRLLNAMNDINWYV